MLIIMKNSQCIVNIKSVLQEPHFENRAKSIVHTRTRRLVTTNKSDSRRYPNAVVSLLGIFFDFPECAPADLIYGSVAAICETKQHLLRVTGS